MCGKTDLTVDVCVLRSGSQTGDPLHYQSSYELMQLMARDNSYLLCLDSRKKISSQYRRQLKQGTFGREWLILMASKNKLTIVQWNNPNRGTKTALKEAHFDSGACEDYKYVVTAAGSDSRVLVTHDGDYSAKVRKILKKRLGVSVLSAAEIRS